MAGIAVSSTGYNHPKVVAAVQEAAGKFLHICGTDFYYEGMAHLCERLAKTMPGQDKYRVFLSNSGTEAVEGAVKLARFHTGRQQLIAFDGAFHGRSYAAVTLTASKVKYKAGFGPLLPGVSHLPFVYPYRGIDGLAAAKQLFEAKVSPKEVAAVIMEPIQGEGGYVMPRREFVSAWRKLCDEHGILLVFDEIQCGVGRTGAMWAAEHYNVIRSARQARLGMPIGHHRQGEDDDRPRVTAHLRRQPGLLRRAAT